VSFLLPRSVKWVKMAVIPYVIMSDENEIELLFPLLDIQEEQV